MTSPPSPSPTRASFRPTVPESDVPVGYALASRGPGAFYAQLILDELTTPGAPPQPTVLDIGCGGGLMSEAVWQQRIALHAGRCLGVEPDAQAQPAPVFERVFRGTFEQAPIDPASVDLAYAAMVIEHVPEPRAFFDQLARVLRPAALAGDDFTLQTWSLHRVGQLDGYVPYRLRRLSRLADRLVIRAGLPGSVLVARMVRR